MKISGCLQHPLGDLWSENTHDVDTLVTCDTDLGALRTEINTNDTHGRGVLEQEKAADSAGLTGLDGKTR